MYCTSLYRLCQVIYCTLYTVHEVSSYLLYITLYRLCQVMYCALHCTGCVKLCTVHYTVQVVSSNVLYTIIHCTGCVKLCTVHYTVQVVSSNVLYTIHNRTGSIHCTVCVKLCTVLCSLYTVQVASSYDADDVAAAWNSCVRLSCLRHGATVHTQFDLVPPYPKFEPKIRKTFLFLKK